MANLIEMSEQLKAVPDQWLEQQIQQPSGMVPPYLMLSELNRRKSLRSKMAQAPQSTVAQDVVGAQPAPPGMATPDTLQNQQPQPQLPQTPTPGLPSPMSGGLAASAPPKPMAPPAPQRMAEGGLVNGFVSGGPNFLQPQSQWFDDDDPWWKRGLGMYGLLGMQNPMLGGLGPALLGGLFAKRKKAAPAAAAPAPAAPAAMAEGGPVGYAGGGYFSSMSLPYNYGTSIMGPKKRGGVEIVTDEYGNRVFMKDGEKLATFAPQPKFELPEYRDTIPKSVKRPDLGDMLAEVKKVTARPEGPTALDRRIESLEGQRDKIRKPFWGDALTELGLGIMASRSPYGMQAVGEAGLGALQSWRQRQTEADRQRMAIDDRLLGVEASREAQAEQNRRADLQLADTMAGREHGAAVTEAQLQASREAQRQHWELERLKAGFDAQKGTHAQDTALQTALLNYELKDPRNLDPNSPEVLAARLASEKELIEHRARMEARFRKPDSGYGTLGKFMQPQFINNLAKGIIANEYPQWDAGGGDTAPGFIGRVQQGVYDKIRSGEINDPMFQIPGMREAVANAAGSLKFDPKDQTFWGGVNQHIKTNRAGAGASTSTGPTQISKDRAEGAITGSGAGAGTTTSTTPSVTVPVPRAEYSSPQNRPTGQSNYLQTPTGPQPVPYWQRLGEKPQSVTPRSEYTVRPQPTAFLREEDDPYQKLLRNWGLLGYSG